MTATTPATAAAITNYDEWVAFYTAPRNISAFARTVISDKLLSGAAAGDHYDQVMVAYEVKGILRLEAMTDVALEVEHSFNESAHLNNLNWDEYDLNDRESHYHEQGLIRLLLDYRQAQRDERAAVARYTGQGPLTHRPFAVLASA
jgi:hypothetical protein